MTAWIIDVSAVHELICRGIFASFAKCKESCDRVWAPHVPHSWANMTCQGYENGAGKRLRHAGLERKFCIRSNTRNGRDCTTRAPLAQRL